MNKIIIMLSFVALLLCGCSSHVKLPEEEYKGLTAEQLFQSGEHALAKHKYETAARYFEALDAIYPFSQYEQQAQLDVIYVYYKSDEFAQAAAAATRYIHLYPRSEHIDYAYYMKGMANFSQDRGVFLRYVDTDLAKRDLETAMQAFNDFSAMITRYPSSPYAADARNRMIYLRNLLARKELLVAKFYYEREAYVAAANRADYIVDHFQQAPVIIPALGMLVESYQHLNLPNLAEQSLSVLAYNYPQSSEYQGLKESE